MYGMGTMQDGRGVWTDLCLVGNGAGTLVAHGT